MLTIQDRVKIVQIAFKATGCSESTEFSGVFGKAEVEAVWTRRQKGLPPELAEALRFAYRFAGFSDIDDSLATAEYKFLARARQPAVVQKSFISPFRFLGVQANHLSQSPALEVPV